MDQTEIAVINTPIINIPIMNICIRENHVRINIEGDGMMIPMEDILKWNVFVNLRV